MAKRILPLVAVMLCATLGLAACSGGGGGSTTEPTLDLQQYTDLPTGTVAVIKADGAESQWDLDDVDDNQAAFEEDVEGGQFVVSAYVLSVKSDYQTRSGQDFETALNLGSFYRYDGLSAATLVTVEADRNTVLDQGIEDGDRILVAGTEWDLKYGNIYAPTEVLNLDS